MSNLEKGQSSSVVNSDSEDEALVFRWRRASTAPSTNRQQGRDEAPSTSGRPEGGEVVIAPTTPSSGGGQEGETETSPRAERRVEVRRRCLVPRGEVEFEAEKTKSTISAGRLSEIIEEFQLPPDLHIRVPGDDDRACSPRPGEIAVYEAALIGGLRFSLPWFVRAVLSHLDLAVGQVVPNSWRLLIGTAVFWAAATGERMKPSEFLHC